MRLSAIILPATLAAIAAAPAWSADAINDVRGIIGFWPSNYESEGNDAGVDDAYRLGAQYMRSHADLGDMGGLIYGGDGSLTLASGDDIDSTALVATGHVGWGYQMEEIEALHFEGTFFLGLGLEQVDINGNDDMGPLIEYGLRAASYYTFDNAWQVGLDLRYLIESSSSQDLGGGDFDYENDGVAVLFGFGKRM
jgi:hypothetical protein